MKNHTILSRTLFVAIFITTFFSIFATYAVSNTTAAKKVTGKASSVPKKATAQKPVAQKKATTKKPVAQKKVTVKKPAVLRKSSLKTSRSKVIALRKKSSSRDSSDLRYGKALDWWTSASKIFSRGETAIVTDLYTGRTFKVVRTMGTNHADCEAPTKADTEIIKSIWGGFNWDRRPVIVDVNGIRIAASMSAMPHAGIDSKPAYAYVQDRSSDFGSGENLDVIKNNGMNGHFDIHFLNSTRHNDGEKDPQHQHNVQIAAGK